MKRSVEGSASAFHGWKLAAQTGAIEILRESVIGGEPVVAFSERTCLPHLVLPRGFFFGGHRSAVYGEDNDEAPVRVADRAVHPSSLQLIASVLGEVLVGPGNVLPGYLKSPIDEWKRLVQTRSLVRRT